MSFVPQIGMAEMILLAIIALVVVGPKDLPRLLQGVAKMIRKVRGMADEFRAGFDQMAREAELDDMRKEIEALKKSAQSDEVTAALQDAESAMMTPLDAPKRAKVQDGTS